MAGTHIAAEPPRSTAYYYADLEKIKRQNDVREKGVRDLGEYLDTNEIEKIKEVPVRERLSPQYSTPENGGNGGKGGETYSTAGTFPMPEPKEKEPLLAELEIVGRVPLTQLDSSSGVRRSRSWYLCCPNVGEEEISRESSWRYSSLRPVTAPPAPGQNGFNMVATHSSGREDIESLRAERDALARALASERQRAAAAGRAHDARLAELHGVIAELMRRRTADGRATVIPEEELSEECESTTQPAGPDVDNDGDNTDTEHYDNSSLTSPAEPETPQEQRDEESTERAASPPSERESSVILNEISEVCLNTARCCQFVRADPGSCDRERGSPGLMPASPGKYEFREAKVASRVRLKRTEEVEEEGDEAWCVAAAERLALDVCGGAGARGEDEVRDVDTALAHVRLWRARCGRLAADCRVLDCALARAVDTAHRLSCACAVQESSMVSLCGALRAADRALEVYDVLLALKETERGDGDGQRETAEAVARRVLSRLESPPSTWGAALLPPGPWAERPRAEPPPPPWSSDGEQRLRTHAARLKRETVHMRALRADARLYSPHEWSGAESVCMSEMEAAVLVQELLAERERRAERDLEGTE